MPIVVFELDLFLYLLNDTPGLIVNFIVNLYSSSINHWGGVTVLKCSCIVVTTCSVTPGILYNTAPTPFDIRALKAGGL